MDWSETPEAVRATPEEASTIPTAKYEYLDHPADVQIHAWGDNLREAFEQSAVGMFGYMTDLETVDIEEVRELEAEAEDLQGLLFHFLDECLFIFACEPFFIARKVVITEWTVGGASGGAEEGGEGKEGKEDEATGEGKDETRAGNEPGTKDTSSGGSDDATKNKEDAKLKGDEDETRAGNEPGTKDTSGGGGGGSDDATKNKEDAKLKGDEDESGERNEPGTKDTSGGGTGGEATSGTQCTGSGTLRVRAKLYGEEFDLEKHPQGTEVKAITYASMQIYDKPGQHEVFVIIDI